MKDSRQFMICWLWDIDLDEKGWRPDLTLRTYIYLFIYKIIPLKSRSSVSTFLNEYFIDRK